MNIFKIKIQKFAAFHTPQYKEAKLFDEELKQQEKIDLEELIKQLEERLCNQLI